MNERGGFASARMLKPPDVFDRNREWSELAAFFDDDRPGATLGVVSGRRRQGKSFLLQAACQQAHGFYFSAQEATQAESLSLIGAALTRYVDPIAPITPSGWLEVLDILLRLGRERAVPVVLNEFPYLVRTSPTLPSLLQAAYAPRRSERTGFRARLLLCGSAAMSFIGKLLSGSAPLHGRAPLDLTVQTLDYRMAAQFWGLHDPRLAFLVHAVVGGAVTGPASGIPRTRRGSPPSRSHAQPAMTRGAAARRPHVAAEPGSSAIAAAARGQVALRARPQSSATPNWSKRSKLSLVAH
jgi:hypothetical protein